MLTKAGVTNASAPSRRSKLGYNTVDANPYHSLGDNMNANELADELHKIYIQEAAECWDVVEEAATMLRQQQEKLTKYELRHVAQRDRIAILEMQHKQQQAEIEALKKEAALQRLSDFTQEADNEPVAWIGKNELQFGFTDTIVTNEKESWDDIPLYTYEQITASGFLNASEPIYPAKTLTDEEITEVFDTTFEVHDYQDSFIKFARAILRKAQEK